MRILSAEDRYNMKFVLVFEKVKGKKPEDYIPSLKSLGREVYSQTHFYLNSVASESFQIGFVPIRTQFKHSSLIELMLFHDLVRRKFPEYRDMALHCKQGHDWGTDYE
jgi:hypothetical protein